MIYQILLSISYHCKNLNAMIYIASVIMVRNWSTLLTLMLVVETDIQEILLSSYVCTPCLLHTHPSWGVRRDFVPLQGFEPIVLWTHGIGLTVVFSHGISPIKERIVTRMCMVLFCIVNNLFDCVGETMRAWRGSAAIFLQAVSLHISGLQ